MAGIGLELQRMLRKETLGAAAQTYTYAGLVGSGPWVISIFAILLIGMYSAAGTAQSLVIEQFQVSVSYLMAGSLILTSPLQMVFVRFAADRMFEGRRDAVLPNLIGALGLTILISGLLGSAILASWFDGPFTFRLCMLISFIVLSCIWVLQIFASAVTSPSAVVLVFAAGYAITVGAAFWLRRFGLEGLLIGFVGGQTFMLFTLLALVVREFPARRLVSFSFLTRSQVFPSLALTGLCYNLGVWADKFIFWGDPMTGVVVNAPLRASPIYDLPIFLAYLSIIPGMSVFFVRMETDVAHYCEAYYRTVTQGGTYEAITAASRKLAAFVTLSLRELVKVQLVTTLVLLLYADNILRWFGMSPLYRPLFSIDLIAVFIQLIVLAMLSILFYLDRRRSAFLLCLTFFAANTGFSILSLHAGPLFYGYGFCAAVILTAILGAISLARTFERLEYETFMLQPLKA